MLVLNRSFVVVAVAGLKRFPVDEPLKNELDERVLEADEPLEDDEPIIAVPGV